MYEQLMGELAGYAGSEGLTPSDLLTLPDGLRSLITWLARRGEAGPADLADHFGCDPARCAELTALLVARGLISVDDAGICRARMAGRRPRAGVERLRKLFDE